MKKRVLVCVWGFVVVVSFFMKGLAEEKPSANLLIIVDSSNSMAQLTEDGIERLGAIKICLGKLVDGLSGNINVGLMFLGHRSRLRYGCKDIEMVIPIGPLDPEIVRKELRLLHPKGVTPLSASLERAARSLAHRKGKSCILLLSDGEDTCGGDPVKTARWIRGQYGISVIVDVVGLNVTERAHNQLSGIATAGGGEYYNVNDTREMFSALTKVAGQRAGAAIRTKKIGNIEDWRKEAEEDSRREEKKIVKQDSGLGTLIIYHGSLKPRSIAILDQETGELTTGSHMWIHSENSYKTSLESGVYRLRIVTKEGGTPLTIKNVVVRGNRTTLINIQ